MQDPVCRYVKVLRALLGLTLRELADVTDVSPGYVHQIEAGASPSRRFIDALSSAKLSPKLERVMRGLHSDDPILAGETKDDGSD